MRLLGARPKMFPNERRQLCLSVETRPMRNPEMLIQYILVRTDMASMNIGRTAAQVGHAANKMVRDAKINIGASPNNPYNIQTAADIAAWENEADGFGTAIVLDGGNEYKIRATVEAAMAANLHAGLVIDPEYYIMDGKAPMLVTNVLTCGYIFGRKDACAPVTSDFKLLGA